MNKRIEGEQEFFMRITNPNAFRKNLLETSKMTLTIIKQTQKIKQLRELKQELMSRISREVKELKLLMEKADDLMPAYNKAELKKYFPEQATPKEQPAARTDFKPKSHAPVSEMDKLSKAIDDIQRKLQSL